MAAATNKRIIDTARHGVATWRKGLPTDDVSLILVYVRWYELDLHGRRIK